MTDFIPVLIAGILVLVVMFMVFGGIITLPEGHEEVTRRTGYYAYNEVSLGYNITVADLKKSYKMADLNGNVSAGMIAGNQKTLMFDADKLDQIDRGVININVDETNMYGSLIVLVNGDKVYSEPSLEGKHTANFDKSVLKPKDNILVVKAEGSGWRIWAPTIYKFDLNLYGDVEDDSEKVSTFNLTYIPSYAKLNLYVTEKEGAGYLKVSINNFLVYRGRSSGFKTFDPGVLREGANRAVITAEPDSRYTIESVYITFE